MERNSVQKRHLYCVVAILCDAFLDSRTQTHSYVQIYCFPHREKVTKAIGSVNLYYCKRKM